VKIAKIVGLITVSVILILVLIVLVFKTPIPIPLSEKLSCTLRGGELGYGGTSGREICFKKFTDGGKKCSDGNQCQSKLCISSEISDLGSEVTGTCSQKTPLFGCHSIIINGKAERTLCAD
jgi:hypothetical protein